MNVGERRWDTILLEAVEVGILERIGKRVEKLYRYVGCEEEKKEYRYGRVKYIIIVVLLVTDIGMLEKMRKKRRIIMDM